MSLQCPLPLSCMCRQLSPETCWEMDSMTHENQVMKMMIYLPPMVYNAPLSCVDLQRVANLAGWDPLSCRTGQMVTSLDPHGEKYFELSANIAMFFSSSFKTIQYHWYRAFTLLFPLILCASSHQAATFWVCIVHCYREGLLDICRNFFNSQLHLLLAGIGATQCETRMG